MNDKTLFDSITDAYTVMPLSSDAIDNIGRTIRLKTSRNRIRRRLLVAVATTAVLAGTVGFTYPIAAANLFGFNVQRNMAAMGAYRVQISATGEEGPGEHINRTPAEVLVDGDEIYMANPNSNSNAFQLVGADHRVHIFHAQAKLEDVYPPNSNADAFYKMPLTLISQLGRFDLAKRMTSRGEKMIRGVRASEVVISEAKRDLFVLDMNPDNGVPISLVIPDITLNATSEPALPSAHLGLRFDYTYDSLAVKKEISRLKSSEVGMAVFDRERDIPTLQKRLFSHPLGSISTGRDLLQVYDVRQSTEGNIFVLYSCKGYHADDNMADSWLRLSDEEGRPWLTTAISMIFSHLGPRGEGIKAQLFIHPDAAKPVKKVRLSIGIDDWEYLSSKSPLPKGTRELELGSYEVNPVACVPLWYFFSHGIRDEIWVTQVALNLRFNRAMEAKDYRRAIKLGLELMSCLSDMDEPLFFTRADLAFQLAKAYRGIGDFQKAASFDAQSHGFHEDSKTKGEIEAQRRLKANRN